MKNIYAIGLAILTFATGYIGTTPLSLTRSYIMKADKSLVEKVMEFGNMTAEYRSSHEQEFIEKFPQSYNFFKRMCTCLQKINADPVKDPEKIYLKGMPPSVLETKEMSKAQEIRGINEWIEEQDNGWLIIQFTHLQDSKRIIALLNLLQEYIQKHKV